jgi:hypothetical protein
MLTRDDAAASTASQPYVCDDRDTPLFRAGTAQFVDLIWGDRKQESFCRRDWTGQIALKPLQKIVPARTPLKSLSGRTIAPSRPQRIKL